MAFQKRILQVIQDPLKHRLSEKEFNALALKTYAWQRNQNPVYRRFCELSGVPLQIKTWKSIPALPVSAFKFHDVTTFKKKDAVKVFKTSGTTREKLRGRHFFKTTAFYDEAIKRLFKAYVVPDVSKIRILSLIPTSSQLPESSLSYMLKRVGDFFGQGKTKTESFVRILKNLSLKKTPVLIFTTTVALDSFLDELKEKSVKVSLPKGSRILETGGKKTRQHEVVRSELLKKVKSYLGIPSSHVLNEYGMTELSSQFYDMNLTRKKKTATSVKGIPPWCRVVIVDPREGKPVRNTKRGLVRILDLANQGSVLAIQTEDEGRLVKEGLEILGRKKGSDLRGCSLTFEEMEELSS